MSGEKRDRMTECGLKPWMMCEGDDEPIGDRRHHVCVCGTGSKECGGYTNSHDADELGDHTKVFEPGEENLPETNWDDALVAYFPAEPCPCMVRREAERKAQLEARRANPVSCDNGTGCNRPGCFSTNSEWCDDPHAHRNCGDGHHFDESLKEIIRHGCNGKFGDCKVAARRDRLAEHGGNGDSD